MKKWVINSKVKPNVTLHLVEPTHITPITGFGTRVLPKTITYTTRCSVGQ